MPSLKAVKGWGFSILGIETVENNEVTKVFYKTCREAFGDVAASNSSGFIDEMSYFLFILLSILLFASVTKQSTKTRSFNVNNQKCKKKKRTSFNTNNQNVEKKQAQTIKRTLSR